MGYEYEPAPARRRRSTAMTRWSGGSGDIEYVTPKTYSEQPREIEEARASHANIQTLIMELSGKYNIAVRMAPQVEPGKHSSPRPSFADETAFLREKVPGIRFPITVPYEDYEGSARSNPTVFKNETRCRGEQKYLLRDSRQFERFQNWMQTYGKPEEWIAQEYIESPGNAPCSYRVLVDCTGHILASQLSYGPPRSLTIRKDRASHADTQNDHAKLLEQPGSEFFLDADNIASTYMLVHEDDTTTGGRISLDPLPISHPYNATEKNLLRAHGLDTEFPTLPPEIGRVTSGIGKALGVKGEEVSELVLGIDLIQRRDTNEYYVIEANRRPSMAPVRDMLGSANSIQELQAWRWVINGALQRVAQTRGR